MPCFRCGAREVDPVRGPSPWKRGVRHGHHVLVCPDCQRGHDWPAELDHCASCGSWRLVRALGQIVCRECGASINSSGDPSRERDETARRRPDLAADVDAALARLWAQRPGR